MSSFKTPKSNSKYYLPPEIYRSVVYWCRCYKRWKKASAATGIHGVNYDGMPRGTELGNPTENAVMQGYQNYSPYKCKIIEDAVKEVDDSLYKWLIIGVTEDVTYNYLRTKHGMPCSKGAYFRKRQQIYYKIATRHIMLI